MKCPNCGSDDIEVREYDYGMDPATGYADEGERAHCRKCGYYGDPKEDFEDEWEAE